MKYKLCTVFTATATLALAGVAQAGTFNWFDDMPARDSLGQVRAPFPLSSDGTSFTFGVKAYSALIGPAADSGYGANSLELYGEVAGQQDDFLTPLVSLNPRRPDQPSLLALPGSRLSGFGVKWRHRVDAANTVAVSAGYSELPSIAGTPNVDALDTRAALSWHGSWSDTFLQPGVSGSVFVGGESTRDNTYQQLGRRYYGFSLGGELRLSEDHTPYLSYRLRRDLYNPDDPAASLFGPYGDRSQIAAGWRWQVQPNWSLRAEARYGLNGANLDPYSPDHSRFLFGTRFDFR